MDPENKITNANVETYAEDMANVISSNQETGLVKRIIKEQEEKEIVAELSPRSKRNRIFMYTGIAMVLIAAATLLALSIFKKNISTLAVPVESQPIIFTDKSVYLEIDGMAKEKIIQAIVNEVNSLDLKPGAVEAIYPTLNKQTIGLRQLSKQLQADFTPGDVNFIKDEYMIGGVMGESKELFILISVRSLSDAYAPMKAWEDKMFSDLHHLFGYEISKDTSYLLTKNFEDGIVLNKNARILKDKDGNTVMMYVFVDGNSVIIANSIEAVGVITDRLAASEIKK
jgi:hypothetical protein